MATRKRVGVEQTGSPSHGDTLGEASVFEVTVPLRLISNKRSQKSISLKYWFSRIGVTSQSYLTKFFLLVLTELNYHSEEQEARQDPYDFQSL